MGHNRKQTALPFMALTRIRLGKNFLTLLAACGSILQRTTMSASGHKLTSRQVRVTSALPLKADIRRYDQHVSSGPTTDIAGVKSKELTHRTR